VLKGNNLALTSDTMLVERYLNLLDNNAPTLSREKTLPLNIYIKNIFYLTLKITKFLS
jgi:hypothetical protein